MQVVLEAWVLKEVPVLLDLEVIRENLDKLGLMDQEDQPVSQNIFLGINRSYLNILYTSGLWHIS